MKSLIRIKRANSYKGTLLINDRFEVQVIHGDEIRMEDVLSIEKATFLEVDNHLVDRVVKSIAETCPGIDIEIYALQGVGYCPAGEFVRKKVTEDGILPD